MALSLKLLKVRCFVSADCILAEKLSFVQVGQLLLIRQGAYDKVGVYYDASASAYQIMGTINNDKKLCDKRFNFQ